METVLATALSARVQEPAEVITPETFDAIMRRHQRRVYRVILLLAKDRDLADGLTQECFFRAYQKRASFRGECRIETWLLRIAVNLVRDHRKNRKDSFWRRLVGLDDAKAKNGVLAAAQPSPEQVLLAREQLGAVWAALDSLSEQQRTIFLLRFVEELPLGEIADLLGLALGSVKTQLFRATGKVRERLRENYGPDPRSEQRRTG